MKISLALIMGVVFATNAFGRSWPKWLAEHVSEIRCREMSSDGANVRVISAPSEIEKILAAFRRATAVRKVNLFTQVFGEKRPDGLQQWQAGISFTGERPESGT